MSHYEDENMGNGLAQKVQRQELPVPKTEEQMQKKVEDAKLTITSAAIQYGAFLKDHSSDNFRKLIDSQTDMWRSWNNLRADGIKKLREKEPELFEFVKSQLELCVEANKCSETIISLMSKEKRKISTNEYVLMSTISFIASSLGIDYAIDVTKKSKINSEVKEGVVNSLVKFKKDNNSKISKIEKTSSGVIENPKLVTSQAHLTQQALNEQERIKKENKERVEKYYRERIDRYENELAVARRAEDENNIKKLAVEIETIKGILQGEEIIILARLPLTFQKFA